MKLNSKLTGGLAWAGLIVVLAVPSADMLTKPRAENGAPLTSDMDGIRTASVEGTPAVVAPTPATKSSGDPVDSYLASGKKLPSYISDAPAEVASKQPATTVRLVVPSPGDAGAKPATEEVASLESAKPAVAPVPYPASKRPKAEVVTASVNSGVSDDSPLILDEELIARREEAVSRVLNDDDFESHPRRVISGEELEEWDSGSLAEYLERRGMMSEDEARQANADDFDEDGFFLDEGPDDDDRRLVRRVRPRNFFFF